MSGYFRRIVIKDLLHDMVGNVTVDQPRGESVPPLVRGEMNGAAVLVADVAVFQPPVEHVPVGAGGEGALPVGVGFQGGEQMRAGAAWTAVKDPLLLLADHRLGVVVDRH